MERLKEGVGYRPDFSRGGFYLDRESGEVEYLNDPDADEEKAEGRDLLAIEPVSEREELAWMAEFAEAKKREGRADEWRQMVSALNGSSPVKQFNAVVATFPGLRAEWLVERERQLKTAAERFLAALGGGFFPE